MSRDEFYPPPAGPGTPFAACHGEVRASERRRVQSALASPAPLRVAANHDDVRFCLAVLPVLLTSAVQRSLFIIRRFLPATPPRRLARRSLGGGGSGASQAARYRSRLFCLSFRTPHSALRTSSNLFPINNLRPCPHSSPQHCWGISSFPFDFAEFCGILL